MTVKHLVSCLLISALPSLGFAQSKVSDPSPRLRLQVPSEVGPEKKWEIRTAPIAILAGWTTVEALYHVTDQLAFGPSYIRYAECSGYAGMFSPSYCGSSLGAAMNYYFKPNAVRTWYLGSHVYSSNYRSYSHPTIVGEFTDKSGVSVNAVLGIQRNWKNCEIMLGGGLETDIFKENRRTFQFVDKTYSDTVSNPTQTYPYIEAKVGLRI